MRPFTLTKSSGTPTWDVEAHTCMPACLSVCVCALHAVGQGKKIIINRILQVKVSGQEAQFSLLPDKRLDGTIQDSQVTRGGSNTR